MVGFTKFLNGIPSSIQKVFFLIPIQKKSGEVDSHDDKLQNLCQQSSVDKFSPQKNICFFQINEKKKKKKK